MGRGGAELQYGVAKVWAGKEETRGGLSFNLPHLKMPGQRRGPGAWWDEVHGSCLQFGGVKGAVGWVLIKQRGF